MSVDIEFHPYANRFPMMTDQESSDLIADIKQRGLIDPIVLFEHRILDGRNRYRSCLAAGVEPRYEEFDGDKTDAIHYVVSRNLRRRELTPSQKAAIALDFEPDFAEAARERQLASLKQNSTPEVDKSPLLNDLSNGNRNASTAAAQSAKTVGANRQYVADAKKIAQVSPETLEKVRRGEVSIPQAKREVGLSGSSERF